MTCGDEVITKGQPHCYYCSDAYAAGVEDAAKYVEKWWGGGVEAAKGIRALASPPPHDAPRYACSECGKEYPSVYASQCCPCYPGSEKP